MKNAPRVLEMLETGQTPRWPLATEDPYAEIVEKEVTGKPSTERTKRMMKRFLDAKCKCDGLNAILYTKKWRELDCAPLYVRRGKSFRYMVENLTPVIHDDELITMSRTRYMRGATPFVSYATKFMLDFLDKAEDEEAKLFSVEGKDDAHNITDEGWVKLGSLFSIREEEIEPLREALEYWKGRSIEDQALKFMEDCYADIDIMKKGWATGIFPGSGLSSGSDGRWIPDFGILVYRGLEDVIAECREHIAQTNPEGNENADKVYFWQGCIEACEGVIQWAKNYANEARRMAAECPDVTRKQELLEMAERLEWVPAKPARTFLEGMQAAWTGFVMCLADSVCLGLSPAYWGRLLNPLYEADLEAGRITPGEALEIWEMMRVKFSSEEFITPSAWAAMTSSNTFQHMTVGGLDPVTGQCVDNDLDEMILQAGINMPTAQPTLGIMVSSKTSAKLLLKAAECTKAGNGYPAWFNYDQCVQHLLWANAEENITLEDARNVAMAGCVEMGLVGTGHSCCQPAFYNEGKTFECACNSGVDPRTGIVVMEGLKPIDSFEDVWENFVAIRDKYMKVYVEYWNYVYSTLRNVHPKICSSILIHDCIGRGKTFDEGGCRYNKTPTLLESGTVNVVNGMAAIKKLVFEDKKYTWAEFKEAMDNNFGFVVGATNGNFSMLNQEIDPELHMKYAQIHKDVLEAPKFGNDDDYVDQVFVNIWEDYERLCSTLTTYQGYRWLSAALSISAHGPHGRVTGATADGRLSGVTLCDGILSAQPGTDTNGPIALIKSGLKLDSTKFRSVQLNMKFHPNAIRGREGSDNFVDFIKSYFAEGGYHVQFNIVDSKMLRDAQKHPKNYRDLMVRVAGFSAYWNELGKPIQDEVIARTEYDAL